MVTADDTPLRRILFFAENAQGWNSLAALAMRFGQRADTAASIMAASCPVRADHESWRFASPASEELFRSLYITVADIETRRWDIFVVTHVSRFVNHLPHQHVVTVCHGSGFGTSAYSLAMYESSTLFCGKSPREADFIAEQTGEPVPAGRFIATGTPRNDRFQPSLAASAGERGEMQRRFKARLGLAEDKPLVLVASHWTPDGILRTFGGAILDALAPLAGACEIVQISHPNLWDDPQHDTYDPNAERASQRGFSSAWIRAALDARQKAGKAKIFYDLESPDLLIAADLLISDYSSIIIEFAMFDRPILFYGLPERFLERWAYDLYAGASLPFRRADDIARLARRALGDPSEKSAGRRRLSDHFNYNIGGATEAICDAIAGLPVGKVPG